MNRFGGVISRWGLLTALACTIVAGPAIASTPSLTWSNVRQVAVHCNIYDARTGYDAVVTRQLCDRVRALAAVGAPMAVRVAPFGDRALTAENSVTLVVQGSTARSGVAKTIMFTIRPHRVSADQQAELFGSTLRAAPMAKVDQAFEQALAEVLPWKAHPLGARPIR